MLPAELTTKRKSIFPSQPAGCGGPKSGMSMSHPPLVVLVDDDDDADGDGDLLEGLLAAQDADSVTLRQPGSEDQRFARTDLRRAGFIRGSVMPEGLLESLDDDRARDLLGYVLTLR